MAVLQNVVSPTKALSSSFVGSFSELADRPSSRSSETKGCSVDEWTSSSESGRFCKRVQTDGSSTTKYMPWISGRLLRRRYAFLGLEACAVVVRAE